MTFSPDMTYQQLVDGYKAKGYRLKKYGEVKEGRKGYKPYKYNLYKIVINPRYKTTLMIPNGFHGDESNGPISQLENIDKVAAHAKAKRVRVVIYICINPSGFDAREHYNTSGEKYNNWFMLYRNRRGKWVGTLKDNEPYTATRMDDSPAREVCALQEDIFSHYYPAVPEAVLDIHQQEGNLKNGEIFAFIFDRPALYRRIMKRLEKIATIDRNDRWFDIEDGRKVWKLIDKDGFVFTHDGTITDMFYRHGSKYVVTAETSTALPLEKVAAINLIWTKTLINLIARDAKKKRKKSKK